MQLNRILFKTLLAASVTVFSVPLVQAQTDLTLTLLHSNDGESQLIDAGSGLEDFGGVARFATVVQNLRTAGNNCAANQGVVLVSSGDNFLAGPEFNASLEKGVPFFDSLALDFINYDAFALGNHEFDFGPEILADFINGFSFNLAPFVSANLDFTAEPVLQTLVDSERIVKSTIVTVCGRPVGIVGATTPELPAISSPRGVVVDPAVAAAIQTEVDALVAGGVSRIILISHLQSAQEDLALIPQLRDVDIAVAGGGSEVLANEGDLLVPGDETLIFGPYPLTAIDANGNNIPVVTTGGNYRYVGRLVADFDAAGNVLSLDTTSGLVRVAGGENPDAVAPNSIIQSQVVDPVQASVDALEANVIATSEVDLDGVRANIRTRETNEGDLIADALLARAVALAPSFSAPIPSVALQNGGGIRNDAVIPAGNFTELDTFDILPFSNFLTVIPDISPTQFKEILENAVSRVEFTDGRFAQIAGFTFTWDLTEIGQVVDNAGTVLTPGKRVKTVTLADGTPIVVDGAVVSGAPAINVASIDFLARGGDQYPFRGVPFINLAESYQQALKTYVEQDLAGVISAAQYPVGGTARINAVSAVRLSTSAASQTIPLGSTASFTISLARANFTGGLDLAVLGLPKDSTASFSQDPATGNSVTLTIDTTNTTPVGTYDLVVTGAAPGVATVSVGLSLTVNPPAVFNDITDQVEISASGLINVRQISQQFTITNSTGSDLVGPLYLSLANVTAGASVVSTTAGIGASGAILIPVLDLGEVLGAGAVRTVTVRYENPTPLGLTFDRSLVDENETPVTTDLSASGFITVTRIRQEVTLTNIGPNSFPGPIFLAVDDLTPGATLVNATLVTNDGTSLPAVALDVTQLEAGNVPETVILEFDNPTASALIYNPLVLQGSSSTPRPLVKQVIERRLNQAKPGRQN